MPAVGIAHPNFALVLHRIRRNRHSTGRRIDLYAARQVFSLPFIFKIFANSQFMGLPLLIGISNLQRIRIASWSDNHAALMRAVLHDFRQTNIRNIVACRYIDRITNMLEIVVAITARHYI